MPRSPWPSAWWSGGCTLVVAAATACAAAAPAKPPAQDCLQSALEPVSGFSGVVLLRKGRQARVAAQGVADDQGTALRADSRFNLGSASKMFTAVAVVQLVEQGKLSLDAPIGRWVEGLAPPVAAVTLRQLLTHSGGLGNFVVPENLQALQQARTVDEQMTLVQDTRPQFEPGSGFRYSNTGFLLLGRAVERASGMAFADYLQQHVLGPAGMASTSLDPEQPTRAATGYTQLPPWVPGRGPAGGPSASGGQPPRGMPPPVPAGPLRPAAESTLPGSPAGSAYSTAGDLARFLDALEAGLLAGQPWLRELTRAHIAATPPGATPVLHYGLGFGVGSWEGRGSFGHNGGAPGVNVEVLRYPADDVLIVVLSNRDPPMASQGLAALRRAAFDDTLCR